MTKSIILLFVGILLAGYKGAVKAEPKESEAETFASIRNFVQVYHTILEEYFEPVSEEALVDNAIAGMYEAGGLEQPSQHQPNTKAVTGRGDKLQQRMRFSAAYGDVAERSSGVSETQILEAAIDRMVGSLDPSSSYMDAESFNALKRQGDRMGTVGVGIKKSQKRFIIDYVIPATPAEAAGLQPGDEIVEIDGESLGGKSTTDAIRMLRGEAGSEVALGLRDHDGIKLAKLSRERVTAARPKFECRLPEQNVLYIRPYGLVTGLDTTLGKLMKALNDHPAGPPDTVILDLRGNGGGVLGVAAGVADLFLNAGTIASIDTRKEGRNLKARPGEGFESVAQVIVLVDKNTASGAELIAAALQDHQRARIVGDHTAGYGTMQTILPMRNGSAIRLTTGRIVRPSGKPLADGVEPDVSMTQEDIEDYSSGDVVAVCPEEGVT